MHKENPLQSYDGYGPKHQKQASKELEMLFLENQTGVWGGMEKMTRATCELSVTSGFFLRQK